MFFSIDGIEWNFPCTIERTSEIRSSDISGMLLDKSYFNDVLGQYMKYTITMVVPRGHETDYNAIYQTITNPVSTHTLVVPYNGGFLSLTGMVSTMRDKYNIERGVPIWRGGQFDFTETEPYRTIGLSGSIEGEGGYAPYGPGDDIGGTTGSTADGNDDPLGPGENIGGNTGGEAAEEP